MEALTSTPGIAFANETMMTYDEGTFTPGISFGGGTTGITYGLQTGNFTKIGRDVSIQGFISLTNRRRQMEALKGKKTYIVAALVGLTTVVYQLAWIDADLYTMVLGLLGAGGLATLRAGMTK